MWAQGVGRSDVATPLSLADVTENLLARFSGQIDAPAVARVVRHCNRELILTGRPASPGAVEHLAARRLADLVEHRQQPLAARRNRGIAI